MTIREKLADWTSGGALSWERKKRVVTCMSLCEARAALSDIAAQETPSANATVRRMAKIAREALTETAD